MDVDKEIKEVYIKNLKHWKDLLCGILEGWIERSEKARTVEELMRIKKFLLLSYLDLFPLSGSECYFCIAKELGKIKSCEECLYGKENGFCYQPGSAWSVIRNKIEILRNYVSAFYYKPKVEDLK